MAYQTYIQVEYNLHIAKRKNRTRTYRQKGKKKVDVELDIIKDFVFPGK